MTKNFSKICPVCGSEFSYATQWELNRVLCCSRSCARRLRNKSISDRLLSKHEVDPETGCWVWVGTTNNMGYGQLKHNRKRWSAHRASYETFNGPIPPDLCVCHTCDNPRCINPAHLFLGTQQDNMVDMRSKGRGSDHVGVANPCAKLTEDEVREIRQLAAKGNATHKEIADRFGISRNYVSNIHARATWSHLDD